MISGFQGICNNRITTFGRGGSDISAVALAVVLNLDFCEIFTDVDGIYIADPKLVPRARKLRSVSYGQMLEISSAGAKVLHSRSVQLAMQHNIKVQVLSTFEESEGTTVLDQKDDLENYPISSIVYSVTESLISFNTLTDSLCALKKLSEVNIKIGIIQGLSFTVPEFDLASIKTLLQDESYVINADIAIISIIGIAVKSHMHCVLEFLEEKKTKIFAIVTSEVKISIIIKRKHVEMLVRDLYAALVPF